MQLQLALWKNQKLNSEQLRGATLDKDCIGEFHLALITFNRIYIIRILKLFNEDSLAIPFQQTVLLAWSQNCLLRMVIFQVYGH